MRLWMLSVFPVVLGLGAIGQARADYDCADFVSREHAQSYYETSSYDFDRLDGDGDGYACEAVPTGGWGSAAYEPRYGPYWSSYRETRPDSYPLPTYEPIFREPVTRDRSEAPRSFLPPPREPVGRDPVQEVLTFIGDDGMTSSAAPTQAASQSTAYGRGILATEAGRAALYQRNQPQTASALWSAVAYGDQDVWVYDEAGNAVLILDVPYLEGLSPSERRELADWTVAYRGWDTAPSVARETATRRGNEQATAPVREAAPPARSAQVSDTISPWWLALGSGALLGITAGSGALLGITALRRAQRRLDTEG